MTYLQDAGFHDTAHSVEVDEYATVYRIESARGTENFPEMECVYLKGHQIAFAGLTADGEVGQWEHQWAEFDAEKAKCGLLSMLRVAQKQHRSGLLAKRTPKNVSAMNYRVWCRLVTCVTK